MLINFPSTDVSLPHRASTMIPDLLRSTDIPIGGLVIHSGRLCLETSCRHLHAMKKSLDNR